MKYFEVPPYTSNMAAYGGDEVSTNSPPKDLLTILFDYTKQKDKRKSITSINEGEVKG